MDPTAPLLEFVLKVDGEYAVVVEAASIEDALALAQAYEYQGRLNARLVEIRNSDNQLDFPVGG